MKHRLKRGAGLLLHISSLPSPYGIGTLGMAAFQFVDMLKAAGQSYWQVLPLGPTSYGDSPYQSFSAFAGNPYFIDLDLLQEEGLLTIDEINSYSWGSDRSAVSYGLLFQNRFQLLKTAYKKSTHKSENSFQDFCRQHQKWLPDYSLYMACKTHFEHHEWLLWEEDIRFRKADALNHYRELLADEIDFFQFLQYKFYQQWSNLKRYANENGISIIGDLPIYVALDSADVWTHPELFLLDQKTLAPTLVAGVPPDDFSETGQLWGNPLYDWDKMKADGFRWWKDRMSAASLLFDFIRIDHFIGIVQYYAIPAGASDGVIGTYYKGPGDQLIAAIEDSIGDTGIIAEDLGIYLPEVKDLLARTGYPGMKVLEFAFGGDQTNEHLPYHYDPNLVVYGGTHDNETLHGYLSNPERSSEELAYLCRYLQINDRNQDTIQFFYAAYSSVANAAIFQVQDILNLGNEARMNTPGTIGENWKWRLLPDQLTESHLSQLYSLAKVYGRI